MNRITKTAKVAKDAKKTISQTWRGENGVTGMNRIRFATGCSGLGQSYLISSRKPIVSAERSGARGTYLPLGGNKRGTSVVNIALPQMQDR